MREVPKTYQQWISCLEYLSKKTVSSAYIESLKEGVCPGIENVSEAFKEKVQDTVNAMLNRSTKQCTKLINESLEEGDYSNIEVILRRKNRELKLCRFYLNIEFLHSEYRDKLDEHVVSEIKRYWLTLRNYFDELVDETGNSQLYDIVYYIKRLNY